VKNQILQVLLSIQQTEGQGVEFLGQVERQGQEVVREEVTIELVDKQLTQ